MNFSTEHIEIPLRTIRPRFKVEVPFSSDEMTDRIKNELNKESSICKGKVISGFAIVVLPKKIQHYWSPQASVNIIKENNKVMLSVLYGPKPNIWTMFVFFYALIGFLTMMVSMMGLSHLSLGKSATVLYFVPVLIILFLSLFFVAHLGKKKSNKQMHILHEFVERCTGEKIDFFDLQTN